mgnify:CR=1 FL=1
MIKLKTKEEITLIKEAGKRLRKVVNQLKKEIEVGITTNYINEKAQNLIKKYGGYPSFKTVKGYKWAICVPINEQIVHTPPSERSLKRGDLLTIDIGLYYQGYHSDYAETILIDDDNNLEKKRFLQIGKFALKRAINQVKIGNYIGDISNEIEKTITKSGYFIIKSLVGHGIGRKLHEDPIVPGFVSEEREKTSLIKEGLVLAIEVIYSQGTENMIYEDKQKWSIITADKSLSACFENTVIATKKGPLIIV